MRVITLVCLAVRLFAADPRSEFRGRLLEGGASSYDGLVVEVTNLRDRTIRDHVDVSSDGSFAFRSVPDGDYQIRVLSRYQDEITSTVAAIGPTSLPFEIRLPQVKLQRPISGTISVQQLSHPLPRSVRKLLESGRKLNQDQHYEEAAARFREAVKQATGSVEAHAGLGIALSNLRQWSAAIEEYRLAISLDPGSSILHSNLSAALGALGQFEEAGTEASAALKLDPQNARAHFVLAGVLLHKGAPAREVVAHLVPAEKAIPSAKTAVDRICAADHVQGCP